MKHSKYPIQINFDEKDGDYLAVVPDLPGCSAFGDTPEEALREAETAIELWLEAARQIGKPIPEPSVESAFSGKFNLRIPKSLHRALALRAQAEGVSLNQLVQAFLSMGVAGMSRLTSLAGEMLSPQRLLDTRPPRGGFHAPEGPPPGRPAAVVQRASVTGRQAKSVAASALTQKSDRHDAHHRKDSKTGGKTTTSAMSKREERCERRKDAVTTKSERNVRHSKCMPGIQGAARDKAHKKAAKKR